MVPTVIGDVSRIGIERCLDQLRYMSEHDMDDALLRCGIPILLIKGEHDLLSSEEIVRDKFEIIPDCQAINVIGSAHCLSVSDPELCAEMIEDFVNQGDLNDVYRAA
jgi:pimeloyl-ACP methyl ester carboxylesterase